MGLLDLLVAFVPLGVRLVCFFLATTALTLGLLSHNLCLGFDLVLNGELIRMIAFPFVVVPGLLGVFHLAIVLLLVVFVGGVCERRIGSVAFLSVVLWLILLVWLAVVLFGIFSAVLGFVVVSVVPNLPSVLRETGAKIPDWRPCPCGFSVV